MQFDLGAHALSALAGSLDAIGTSHLYCFGLLLGHQWSPLI
jgi:hypothetical protein